jgi:hypothetical protein
MLLGSHDINQGGTTMQRTARLSTTAAVVLILGLSACGGSGGKSSAADIKDKIADQFVDSGLEKDAADCFADVIVDEIGADKLNDVDFSAEQPPAGLADDLADAAAKATDDCDLDPTSLDG